jgi:NADPH-dependent 2,4-dienoyl-CoA reductase/sulfur reductase-like enzyme
MTARERVVVVGAGAAGVSTAMALRAFDYDGQIVVIGGEDEVPYDRPPLSKQVLSGQWELNDIRLHPDRHYDENDIELLLGTPATAFDLSTRSVWLADGTHIDGDVVVIATGVRPRSHPLIHQAHGAVALSTGRDAVALRDALAIGVRLTVVGGGYLGLEVAATAAELGCLVDVVDRAPVPLAGRVPALVSHRLAALHHSHGVVMHPARTVESSVSREGRIRGLRLDDGRVIESDLVVVAVGSAPNVEWLANSGLDLTDGIRVDVSGRATDAVFAVGDIASSYDPFAGRHTRHEHRGNASESAVRAAAAIVGRPLPPPAAPSFWSDQYDVKLQFVGIVNADAEFALVEGDGEGDRFAGTLTAGGRLVGAVAWNASRALIPLRRQLTPEPALAS